MHVPKCPCCGLPPTCYTLRWNIWGHWCAQHQKNLWWDYDTFTLMGCDYLATANNFRGETP